MKTKKAVLLACVLVLVCAVLFSIMPSARAAEIYDNVIRLHVIANSDSEEDQNIKLAVRDSVLAYVGDALDGCGGFDDAYAALTGMKAEIEEAAQGAANGANVRIAFGRETYPTRYYGDYALPAGEYVSMRIIIGDGDGHNWWCVLFPPLCSASAAADTETEFYAAGFTPEEYRIIKRTSPVKYRVRFRILELLSETFGFSY